VYIYILATYWPKISLGHEPDQLKKFEKIEIGSGISFLMELDLGI
jgi:hypothetical protein